MTLLAINIHQLRKRNKITQDQLAARCEVSGAAVSQWESKTSPTTPDINNLLVMAKIFDTSIEQMMCSENIETEAKIETELDTRLLVRVFAATYQTKGIAKHFTDGNLMRKASIFKTLYTLYQGMALDDTLNDLDTMTLIGLEEAQTGEK